MSHDIGRERDYPVIDRAPDDDDRDERIEQDAEAEYHPDHDRPEVVDGDALADDPDRKDVAIDLRDDLDAGDADRRDDDPDRTDVVTDRDGDGVIDGSPGDTPEDHHDGVPRTTAVPVDDIAAQDSGVVPVVPPATDDADAVRPAGAEVAPAVVPVAVPVDPDRTDDLAGTDDADAAAPAATSTAADEDAWRELQLTFVDDPAAAVRDAADLLEKAVADLRQKYEGSDSTEDLRTAFRRYRDVYRGLR